MLKYIFSNNTLKKEANSVIKIMLKTDSIVGKKTKANSFFDIVLHSFYDIFCEKQKQNCINRGPVSKTQIPTKLN